MPVPVKMKFICDQDWDDMQPTGHGRYCEMCKKEVLDLTRKTSQQLRYIQEKNGGDACGIFTAEQVYDDIIIPLNAQPLKRFVAAAASVLVLSTGSALAQSRDTVPTEQVDTASAQLACKDPVISDIRISAEKPRVKKRNHSIRLFNIGRRGFYLTRRFPFFRSRVTRLMGKYAY